jgi:hypothetical protein
MDRSAKVRDWLDKNVIVIESVSTMEIKNITFRIDEYSGAFDAVINGIEIPFKISGDNPNGRITIIPPIAHSPHGVPASYPLLKMPSSVDLEISEKLQEYIPPLLPLGWDKETGQKITAQHSIKERIEDERTVLKSIKIFQQDGFKVQIR